MTKLLIIADDFTGALDTGVQFATVGAVTKVITDNERIIEEMKKMDESVEVLVVNTETRHMDAEDAYKVIFDIAKRAHEIGVFSILKKTDSALRGNIGSELSAVLMATDAKHIHFIPALPKMKRITKKGMQLIDGIPVHESVFANDPFKPVKASYIPDIIAEQSNIKVSVVEGDLVDLEDLTPTIFVYDAESDVRIHQITKRLTGLGVLKAIAGCSGLAAVLPELLDLNKKPVTATKKINRLLILCGSVNPITGKQLDYAESKGVHRIRLKPHQKLYKEYYESDEGIQDIKEMFNQISNLDISIIDSNDIPGDILTKDYAQKYNMSLEDIRTGISSTLGLILKKLIEEGLDSAVLITGGDTLIGFMKQMNVFELNPLYEMSPGTVLSDLIIGKNKQKIISKSGGFGEENLFVELAEKYVL